MTAMFKVPLVRDRKWLDYLKTQPCVVTGWRHDTEPAHLRLLGSGGTGIKPSDNRALSLYFRLHREQSKHGEGASWIRWTREYPEYAARLAEKYPELWFRFLIGVAEAEYDEYVRGYAESLKP